LIEEYIIKFNQKGNLNLKDGFYSATAKFVGKMEIKMTMPEDVVVGQEDPADKNDDPDETDSKLYFIASGSCEVTVRTNNDM